MRRALVDGPGDTPPQAIVERWVAARRAIAVDPRPVRVTVVDDCPLVTAGLAAMLEPFAERARACPRGRVPDHGSEDVVLFDASGRPDAEERLQELLTATGSKVLIYAWSVDPGRLSRFVQLGASGFVSKSSAPETLVSAVELARSGLPWASMHRRVSSGRRRVRARGSD